MILRSCIVQGRLHSQRLLLPEMSKHAFNSGIEKPSAEHHANASPRQRPTPPTTPPTQFASLCAVPGRQRRSCLCRGLRICCFASTKRSSLQFSTLFHRVQGHVLQLVLPPRSWACRVSRSVFKRLWRTTRRPPQIFGSFQWFMCFVFGCFAPDKPSFAREHGSSFGYQFEASFAVAEESHPKNHFGVHSKGQDYSGPLGGSWDIADT